MNMPAPCTTSQIKTVAILLLASFVLLTLPACDSDSDYSDTSTTNEESAGTLAANDALLLTVNGPGYLLLSVQSGELVYRRSAIFGLDADGFIIVSTTDERLQGNATDSNGLVIPGVPSDLQIALVDLALVEIDEAGLIFFTEGGERMIFGQITLANFSDPDQLNELEPGLFSVTFESGQPIIGAPGIGSMGTLRVESDDQTPQGYAL